MITPCEFAQERHRNLVLWRNLWSILIFAFGSAVTTFLICAVFLALRKNWLPAAISTLGTLVTGTASKWVLDRRKDAVTEEEEAYKQVMAVCQSPTPATALRTRLKLFRSVL